MVIFNRPNTVRSMITCQIFHQNVPIQPITFTSRCSEKQRALLPPSLFSRRNVDWTRESGGIRPYHYAQSIHSVAEIKESLTPWGKLTHDLPVPVDTGQSTRLGPVIEKSVCNEVFNLPFRGSFAQDTWPRRCRIRIGSSKLGSLHSSWLGNVKYWHAVDISCCTTDVHNACCRWSVCPGQVGYPWCWTQRKWK